MQTRVTHDLHHRGVRHTPATSFGWSKYAPMSGPTNASAQPPCHRRGSSWLVPSQRPACKSSLVLFNPIVTPACRHVDNLGRLLVMSRVWEQARSSVQTPETLGQIARLQCVDIVVNHRHVIKVLLPGLCEPVLEWTPVLRQRKAKLHAPLGRSVLCVQVQEVVEHLTDILQGPLARLTRDAIGAGIEVLACYTQTALPKAQALHRTTSVRSPITWVRVMTVEWCKGLALHVGDGSVVVWCAAAAILNILYTMAPLQRQTWPFVC